MQYWCCDKHTVVRRILVLQGAVWFAYSMSDVDIIIYIYIYNIYIYLELYINIRSIILSLVILPFSLLTPGNVS